MTKIQLTLTFILVFISSTWACQKDSIPRKTSRSIPALTQYLTADKTGELEKVEAVYNWITHNIAYDYDKLESGKMLVGVDPTKILKSRKAICSGYVELMRAMLAEIDIKSETVSGYIKDSHWQVGDTLFEESHAWISFRIKGEWYLADPTWDAGYIGRIPKKDFRERRYLQHQFKSEQRETRVLARREERKEKRYAAWEEKEEYTNKTGFVYAPSKDYFMVHPDTFLLSHLPTYPIWQLRNHPISLLEFTQSETTLKKIIAQKNEQFAYKSSANNAFIRENFLDQLIIVGDEGQPFNIYNPGIKMLNYFNYLNLITRNDLQRVARGSVYSITPSKYPDLLAKTDTVSEYLKAYKKFEKAYYKKNKTIDKEEYKIAQSNNKDLFKNTEKLLEKHESFIDDIKENSTKIEDLNEKYTELINKIAQSYPKAINYEPVASFDTTIVAHWMDSISELRSKMDARMDELNNNRKNTCVKRYIYSLSYSNKVLLVNQSLIPYNNYSTSATINELDSIAIAETGFLLDLINDSIDEELIDREIYGYIKSMEMITKKAKLEFRELKAQSKIDYPFRYEIFLNALLYEEIQRAIRFNNSSLNFNTNVVKALKNYSYLPKEIHQMTDEQENLKEDKFKFNSNLTEKDHERTEDLIKHITAKVKTWEKKYQTEK
ncbi:Transglutaminase-like superfamily protein [Lishizhenia tianjinensis]|uniref:Transglutaminase-like superfamily protein n=1 Tax=Lishizhenia tianjinensis TaxID=477690 RepID=A0A1I7BRQ5_9FLAO|nr:transglutaminase domain-containing protein [Lishizhenia tianjinensis]SFT89874.1 Transglutaminase-like superfamily protein [Lishizhenia tianjinensis]